MDILTYAGIFVFGTFFGIILTFLAIHIFRKYDGVIKIILMEKEEKTVYSLELFDDPEQLMVEKKVLFKVDTSVE